MQKNCFLLLDVLTNQKTSLSFVTIFAIKKIEKTEKDIPFIQQSLKLLLEGTRIKIHTNLYLESVPLNF